MIDQRSTSWKILRLGKITASEIYVLMKDRKEPMTEEELAEWKAANPKSRVTTKTAPFSDATFTYLNRKVMENFLPKDDELMITGYLDWHDISSRAMDFGTEWEADARAYYSEIMGIGVDESEFIPYKKYPNLVGGSPDGLNNDGLGGLEIKNPFTLEKHMQHLLYKTPQDLKENDEQYYWQCVANMMFCEREYWDFMSYSPYISSDLKAKIIRIPKDDGEFKLLADRIDIAAEYMQKKLVELSQINKIITDYGE